MTTRFQSMIKERADDEDKVELDANIGGSTYFEIGGQADILVRPHSTDSLSCLLHICLKGLNTQKVRKLLTSDSRAFCRTLTRMQIKQM